MSPEATEGVVSREAPTFFCRSRSSPVGPTPSGRFAAISPSRGEITRRYTSTLLTIIASGDGILPRKAV
jgi:hypothetical protein